MATPAKEGATYEIDLKNRKPPHIWVVLHDPDHNGEFLIVSLTDKDNYPANDDIWNVGWAVTVKHHLVNESVIPLRFVRVADQDWLDDLDPRYLDSCTPDTLSRARCNLKW